MDGESCRDQRPPGVGALLRTCRLRAGVSLSEAAETLNIRRPYLQAIEEGRYRDLPGPTYALGFVRGYAEYLGLDGNEIARRYRAEISGSEGIGTRRARGRGITELNFSVPASEAALPNGSILLVGAMIALIAYSGWYVLTAGERWVPERIAPLPERLAALLLEASSPETPMATLEIPPVAQPEPEITVSADTGATEAASAEPVTGDAAPDEAEPSLASGRPVAGPVASPDQPRIRLEAAEQTWVEIRDDSNSRVLSRLMAPGETIDVPDRPGLRLTVGNAGGLEIKLDGEPLPPLGGPGAVRRNVPLEAEWLRNSIASAN